MLPLGVVAYSTAGNSPSPAQAESPLKHLRFRKQSKSSSVRLSPIQVPHNSHDSNASDTSPHTDRGSVSNRPKGKRHLLARFSIPERSFSLRRSQLKHLPIVIPRHGEHLNLTPENSSPLIDSTTPLRTPTSITSVCPSLSEFPLPSSGGRKLSEASTSSCDPASPHPRHVEIKIPAWIPPLERLPQTSISLPSPTYSLYPSSSSSPQSPFTTMARPLPSASRSSTMDSATAVPSAGQLGASGNFMSSVNSSQTSLSRWTPGVADSEAASNPGRTPGSAYQGAGPSPNVVQTARLPQPQNSGLSGLVCNVHRTTGKEPRPLVGATTTIVGDKLYVFGGRRLSRTRPQLTSDLYELDLIRRHWTRIEARGDIPPPRYFHSVCALGDTKLVCYGGMSPSVLPNGQPTIPNQPLNPQDPQPEVVVMSDIHIYDIPTRTWMRVPTSDSPQGRYAHCASILPSYSVFASTNAPLSAIHHNLSSPNAPNSGQIGITLDGSGGAEMVVVGGQDSSNHYIEQISVFNLRSLRWTSTTTLGRSCGAYRSVTAPLSAFLASQIGAGEDKDADKQNERKDVPESGSAMLIYSNYNFLDVKLELQVRMPDGTLIEKPMQGNFSPPGLRFPNGGVLDNHFVVSGTFLTSSKQEYALWALNLRSLTWSRIDAGGATFTQGSWNRGVLWNRRNTFIILGNRKRSLVEDYNHRRINFSNICMVELEAFGLYDNPRRTVPTSEYLSASSPRKIPKFDPFAGGRQLSKAAEELGTTALGISELCDMDFLSMNGERIPANSRLIARRWGPYFNQLLREGLASAENDTATLRPTNSIISVPSRNSSLTITPSVRTQYSNSSTLLNKPASSDGSSTKTATPQLSSRDNISVPLESRNPAHPNPSLRPRTLYLPHTPLTIQALLQYLYTSSLPPPTSNLCTPQILCSLLQLARPYKIDGLLEAVVERLHAVLDNRNTAAIFNAAAMAAGGGDGVRFFNPALGLDEELVRKAVNGTSTNGLNSEDKETINLDSTDAMAGLKLTDSSNAEEGRRPLRINTDVPRRDEQQRPGTSMSTGASASATSEDEMSSASAGPSTGPSTSSGKPSGAPSASASMSDLASQGRSDKGKERADDGRSDGTGTGVDIWKGEISAVIGLQKRGLRGLMEGRRIREMVREGTPAGGVAGTQEGRVGLGIA